MAGRLSAPQRGGVKWSGGGRENGTGTECGREPKSVEQATPARSAETKTTSGLVAKTYVGLAYHVARRIDAYCATCDLAETYSFDSRYRREWWA